MAVKISDKASAFLGQKVDIEDLSFSPSAGINLYNITVRNPEGFAAGDLLRIRKIFLKVRYGDLPKGRLYFTSIAVDSPVLSISRNNQGRMNISDRLLDFFKKKPALTYQIDDFEIKSGSFDFRDMGANLSDDGGGGLPEGIFRNDNINVRIKNLSSNPGSKTSISGNTIFAGGSEIDFDGWAYLKDEPRRLNISLLSKNISLAPVKTLLGRYGVSTEKTRIIFSLNSEGDTEKGFRVKSEIAIKEAGLKFFRNDAPELLLDIEAFLNIRENSLALDNISLQSGKSAAVVLHGQIRDLFKEPVYTADLTISGLDLSAFHFVKGLQVSGVVTSDNVHVQGAFKKSLPDISGAVQLRDASLASNDNEIRKINASLKFSSRGGMTIEADATAKLLKSFGYVFDKPAEVRLLMTARGNLKNMALKSSVDVSPVQTHLRDGRAVSLKSVVFSVEGRMKPDVFDGTGRVEMKELTLAAYHLPWLRGAGAFERRGSIFTVINPALDGGGFKSSAGRVTVRLPEKGKGAKRMSIEVKGMSASYPEEAAGLKKADISLQLDAGGQVLSGDLGFSLNGITYRGLNASVIAGRGRFDGKGFSVDVPRAEMAGGTVQLAATGSTKEGPFPAKLRIVAERIDIGALSKEALKISGMPYEISGDLKRASFEGLLESARSVRGNSGVTAEKITLRKIDSKRDLVKGVALNGTMEFRGKDVDFKADAAVGKVATGISGTMKDFQMKNRAADVRIKLPNIGAADLRDSLWDSFPDSLLYAGLTGSLSADLAVDYRESDVKVNGGLTMRELAVRGENGEFSVGPINGVLPVAYRKAGGKGREIDMPSFDRSEFDSLSRLYSKQRADGGDSLITIGALQYGFRFLENVSVLVRQEAGVLNVRHFSSALFGGKLNGSAVIDLSKGFSYRVGMILEGLSMTKLCEEIEPIKGYISGKINGVALLKGSGSGISQVIGKAEFWTYGTNEEPTKISREFLKKIGGPSVKAYLGDRRFDRGEMSLYLQNGFVIFKDLEISNRNIFGMRDLSIQVAPLNNRISIDHLMWSITEAAQRAKEK